MAATGTRAPLGMPMDVYRAEDGSYHVETDLPGVDPDGVEVTVEHGTLTIQAGRSPHLGEGVDSANLTASYADGVLHVTIPASPKARARRVEIPRTAGGSRTISGSAAEQAEPPAGTTGADAS